MKKLILLLFVAMLSLNLAAQDLTASRTGIYIKLGGIKDTLSLNDSVIYSVFVPSYCESFKLQVSQDTVSGTAKTRSIIQSSLDYSNWTEVDTVDVTGVNYGIGEYLNPRTQYVRIITKAIDNTQVVIPKYYMLINKKE